MTLGILATVAAVNFTVDPLRTYHLPFFPIRYVKNARFQHPGLARLLDYDAVVIGSSHCDNYRASDIGRILGWDALRLSLSGSNAHEQRMMLDVALERGQVRRVLWGLDDYAFASGAGATASLPEHLYRTTWQTPCKYLLSLDTLQASCKCVLPGGERDLDGLLTWENPELFSAQRVLTQWPAAVRRTRWVVDEALCRRNLEQCALRAAVAHPDVEFHFFFPPYSILTYVTADGASPALDRHLVFKALAFELLSPIENCVLHDFQDDPAFTHDLEQFRDLTHHAPAINRRVLAAVAAGSHRLTVENYARRSVRFSAQVHAARLQADQPDSLVRHLREAMQPLTASAPTAGQRESGKLH